MKNYWKRFAAWATGLRNDPFDWAQLKLTAIYTISIVVVFFVTNITLFNIWFNALSHLIPSISGPLTQHQLTSRLDIILGIQSAGIYIIILIIIIAVSYLISSGTLSPIHNIMRAQKRFIADASHELRTPLAIMKTNSEVVLLDSGNSNPEEIRTVLKENLEEIDRMSKIIQNLLALSYYDNQFAQIPFEKIDLSKLIARITERTQSLAHGKLIALRLLNNDSGIIMGNPVALEELAINLIRNAITYTPSGGQISISVTAKKTMLEFRVKDTGVGIERKDLSNVFSPFYKAGQGRVQLERESSGLGLTIVKKIVERHHGTIYINSAVGKGTTIIISFPLLLDA